MNRRRITKITVETERRVILVGVGRASGSWCARCGKQARAVEADELAAITGFRLREIHTLLEIGRIHLVETDEGALLICLNSLL